MFTWSNNKEFLVNEAYSMLIQAQPLTSPIGSDDVRGLWRGIWKNKGVTPRIRTFFWKAITGAFPSAYALSKRIANIETSCRVYGAQWEDTLHILFYCSHARATWFISPLGLRMLYQDATSVQEVLLQLWRGWIKHRFHYLCVWLDKFGRHDVHLSFRISNVRL